MNYLVCLSVLLVALCAGQSVDAKITCYTCGSMTDEDLIEESDGCAQLKTTTTMDIFDYCYIKYTTSANGMSTIERGGGINKNETTRCEGDYCFCGTDKCNSQVVKIAMSLECYECNSADYFDNGCGDVLDVKSEFVHKVKGCSACGKTVIVGSDYTTSYQRGCVRAAEVEDNDCFGEEADSKGMVCVCTGALCNSAHALQFTAFSLLSTSLLFVAKLYC
jgi:hypothetical protein